MLVVSLALTAVLVAGGEGGDVDVPDAATVLESRPTPLLVTAVVTAMPALTTEPPSVPALSLELKERLNALPEKLRNETQYAYATGVLSVEQLEQIATDYENRNPAVRVGSVLAVDGATLRFTVFTTGEAAEVATGEQTLIRRGDAVIALADLTAQELVMVVSTDEGATALTIEAFGVVAP